MTPRQLIISFAALSLTLAACNTGKVGTAGSSASAAPGSTASAKQAGSAQIVPAAAQAPQSSTPISVTSQTFPSGTTIPAIAAFSGCGGGNVSPQLTWTGAPASTRSYALTIWDPDAPTGVGYVHWVVFNIPARTTALAAGAGKSDKPGGGMGGYSDFGMHTYGGPCPPQGDPVHRYVFTVSALDVDSLPGAGPGTTYATLTFMMRGHVLAQGSLTGKYGR